jgi:hypothetical protein
MDPRIRIQIHTRMSWNRNTAFYLRGLLEEECTVTVFSYFIHAVTFGVFMFRSLKRSAVASSREESRRRRRAAPSDRLSL